MKNNQPTIKDLQNVLLELLLEFDRICRKNNIPYALTYGSALGIVNYQGFIPWDDDIDISIDYFDLTRLIEALNNDLNHDKYYYQCYEVDSLYNVLIPTIKLRKKNTYIKEKNCYTLPNRCKSGDGIFVDIVAFMGVPNNKKEHYRIIKHSKMILPLYFFLDTLLRINPLSIKKKLKKIEQEVAEKYKDSSQIGQTVIIPFQDWGENRSLSFPKEVLYPLKEYDFMGHKVFSYNDIVAFAKLNYGEKAIKHEINGKLVDSYPFKKRKAKHFRKIVL